MAAGRHWSGLRSGAARIGALTFATPIPYANTTDATTCADAGATW